MHHVLLEEPGTAPGRQDLALLALQLHATLTREEAPRRLRRMPATMVRRLSGVAVAVAVYDAGLLLAALPR